MDTKQRIYCEEVAEPADGLWSNCMKVGQTVYISGLTSRNADGVAIDGEDEYQQAKIIFNKIKAYIEAVDGCMDDVVSMTIYVTRIAKNKEVWRARREFFSNDFPTCALVEVSALATPEIYVEISAIAYIGCSS